MSELNGGIPVDVNPNIEIDAPIEAEPTIELQAEVEAEPTIELQASVEMGSKASEYNAEAWAVGERGGVPVSETDQTFHNNAKYYAENTSKEAEAWAVGERGGVPVSSTDPTYNNNSKYYAEQSADAARAELNKKADVINISDDTPEAVKTFDKGADGMPMALTVGIEPVQGGSGDPSPTNIRPISGWTGCNIVKAGKNHFDISAVTDSSYYTIVDGIGTSTRAYAASAVRMNNSDLLLKAGMKIVFSADVKISNDSTDTREVVRLGYKLTGSSGSGNTNNSDFTLSGADTWERVSAARTIADTGIYTFGIQPRYSGHTVMFKNVQIEIGTTTPGDYEPYQGSKYSISFPSSAGTVYGGTLTVNKDGTGTLVVNLKKIILTGSETWKQTTNAFYAEITGDYLKASNVKGVCDTYDFVSGISGASALTKNASVGMYTGASNNRIYIRDDQYADTTAFKNALATNNVTVIYELATPSEPIPLTELEVIETLKGLNNIFTDTGDILFVEYPADTKMYVDQKNEEDWTDITAIKAMIADIDTPVVTESHGSGDLFICENKLYKAIDNISAGETLIVGENVNLTTIAENIPHQDVREYFFSWRIGSSVGYGSYNVYRLNRLRTLYATLNPVCFNESFLEEDDLPTEAISVGVDYYYYQNNQRIDEPCQLYYSSTSNTWELIRSDGTHMALGDDMESPSASDRICFSLTWFV